MRIHRCVKRIALALALAALGYLGFVLFDSGAGHSDYQAVVSELDRADPGWRNVSGEPGQPSDPAAQLIADIDLRLGPDREPPSSTGSPVPGPEYVPPAELLADALRLADTPGGPVAPQLQPRDWLPGPPPASVRAAARVARLLFWGGARSARRGEYPDTARAAAGIARVRRALIPDARPTAIRTRLECSDLVVALVALALAEGPIPAPALDQMAAVLREEPASAVAEFAHCDRALCHACLEEARSGSLRHPDLPPQSWEEQWHARALRALTRSVEFTRTHADEPLDAVRAALPQLAEAFQEEGKVADRAASDGRAWAQLKSRHLGLLEELFEGVATSNLRVRCTRAGLAAERYRVRHGAWPQDAARLTPEFLAAWPNDPRNGRPLHWERFEGGLHILGSNTPAAPVFPQVPADAPTMMTATVAMFTLLDPPHRVKGVKQPAPPR